MGFSFLLHKRRFHFIFFPALKFCFPGLAILNAYPKVPNLQPEAIWPPRGHVAMSQLVVTQWEGAPAVGIWWVQDRGATKHPKMQGQLPTTKNHTTQNVSSAEVEKH